MYRQRLCNPICIRRKQLFNVKQRPVTQHQLTLSYSSETQNVQQIHRYMYFRTEIASAYLFYIQNELNESSFWGIYIRLRTRGRHYQRGGCRIRLASNSASRRHNQAQFQLPRQHAASCRTAEVMDLRVFKKMQGPGAYLTIILESPNHIHL